MREAAFWTVVSLAIAESTGVNDGGRKASCSGLQFAGVVALPDDTTQGYEVSELFELARSRERRERRDLEEKGAGVRAGVRCPLLSPLGTPCSLNTLPGGGGWIAGPAATVSGCAG